MSPLADVGNAVLSPVAAANPLNILSPFGGFDFIGTIRKVNNYVVYLFITSVQMLRDFIFCITQLNFTELFMSPSNAVQEVVAQGLSFKGQEAKKALDDIREVFHKALNGVTGRDIPYTSKFDSRHERREKGLHIFRKKDNDGEPKGLKKIFKKIEDRSRPNIFPNILGKKDDNGKPKIFPNIFDKRNDTSRPKLIPNIFGKNN